MNARLLPTALAAALALCAGIAYAVPPPDPDADPVGALRFALSSLTPQAEAAAEAPARQAPPPPPDDLVQGVVRHMSPLPNVLINVRPARVAASHSITRAAAAVLAVRAKTGAFPAALPGAFLDPYRPSKMLQYRREGAGGFVVYSAGPDGKGDGGRPGDRALPSAPSFRYPSVPIPVPAADAR